MKYTQHIAPAKQSQKQEIIGQNQVKNSAGGYVFQVDKWNQLERFLILGNENGSYYAGEREMTINNVKCLEECLSEDFRKTIDLIEKISVDGRAPKNDPAIFALAYCAGKKYEIGSYACSKISSVCRIGTHLFQFVEAVRQFRGMGYSLRKALQKWYLDKSNKDLAYQLAKYQSRGSYSHRDVLRLCKPKTQDSEKNQILRWSAKNDNRPAELNNEFLLAVEEVKTADVKRIIQLIQKHRLPREVIPTHHLNNCDVWMAMLEDMPMTALIRNLGKMSSLGLTKPLSEASKIVCEKLQNEHAIKKAKLHPLAIFNALKVYSSGNSVLGKLSWYVDDSIVCALDDAFVKSFKTIEPANKRFLLGIDVSSSMGGHSISGMSITAREAAAIMSMATKRTEPYCHTMAFSHKFVDLSISANDSLNEVLRKTSCLPFGATDCALPMIWAMENKISVDTFVVYTDNETHFGKVHPFIALKNYRQKMGIPAKLVVAGMRANQFTIADPSDNGMLDVVGFDTAAPSIISNFAK